MFRQLIKILGLTLFIKIMSPLIGTAQTLNITAMFTNIFCKGESTGSINITVSGGTIPYVFNWSNSATTEDLSGLVAGTFTVTVTDANLQTNNYTAILSEPVVALTAEIDFALSQDTICYGFSTGTAVVVAQGGTTPYSYSWNTLPPKLVSQATGISRWNLYSNRYRPWRMQYNNSSDYL